MKATVAISDLLFKQAKVAARGRGITLQALTELDRRVAIHPGHAEDVAAFEFADEVHSVIPTFLTNSLNRGSSRTKSQVLLILTNRPCAKHCGV